MTHKVITSTSAIIKPGNEFHAMSEVVENLSKKGPVSFWLMARTPERCSSQLRMGTWVALSKCCIFPNITEEFVTLVRGFFKDKYGVEDLGFTNTIITIFAKN